MTDRTDRGLDGLNFFMANVQTGFGPFVASYLAIQAWTQGEIGLALSIGTVTFMAAQVPAGALVDAIRNKRAVAAVAVLAIVASALLLALFPTPLPVYAAEVLHGLASCVVTPAVAALSLAASQRPGSQPFGERLGRNARFASIGSGIAAAVMGICGYALSEQSVFLLAAAMALPALLALRLIQPQVAITPPPPQRQKLSGALMDRRLLIFAVCCFGFHLANAALFPFVAVRLTREGGSISQLVIAACLVVPQMLVAAISPWVGRYAQDRGRRRILLLGFAAVPLRGALFAVLHQPLLIVAAQALDGVSGAVFGVLLPLVVADITQGTGRYTLSMGAVGLAIGAGATASTGLAGVAADHYHAAGAFAMLTGMGLAVVLLLWAAMPETDPARAVAYRAAGQRKSVT